MARKSSTLEQLADSYQQHFNALSRRMQLPKTSNKCELRKYMKARRKLFSKSYPKLKTFHQLHWICN